MEQSEEKQKYFLSLYEPVSHRLSLYIRSLVWDRDDAKDLAAETVLIAYESMSNLKAPDAFMYYLFGIASRLIKQRERKKKLWRLFTEDSMRKGYSTYSNAEAGLDTEVLYKALQRLTMKEREAIVMFEISGFSLKEIQELQKDTLSAVKSRLSRGRVKLAKMLQSTESIASKSSTPTYATLSAKFKMFMLL